jgi:endoglucanase
VSSPARPHQRRRVLIGAVAGAAVAAAAVALTLNGLPAQAGSIPTGTQFYADPNSQAARWVAANSGDSRASAINSRIAQVPSGIWFASYNPSTITSSVSAVTSAAKSAGKTPVLVVYEIPNRDCGGASAGGAPDLTSYGNWVRSFAAGLNGASVIVILEPDSLALQTCLSASDATARDNAIGQAATTIKGADSAAKVYLDAGHSAWNSASDQANRLNAAGVKSADGFFSNVSNFNLTGNEVSYDKSILSALGNPSNLHAVVDTSRNGNGSNGQWCDPSGRALGQNPTAATGDSAIDAFLWVKPPGESDGCADSAGVFDPALAYALITNGPPVSTSPSAVRSSSPSASPSPSATSASPSPSVTSASPSPSRSSTSPSASPSPTGGQGGGCHVTYAKQSEWPGGFVAQLTVANNGTTTINNWTLAFAFGGDQKITSVWNAAAVQNGQTVTVTPMSYNSTIAAGQNVSFGFQGTWTSSDASPTSFTVNGATCS